MVGRGDGSEAGGVKEGCTEAYQGRSGGWGGALMLYVKAYLEIRKQRAACSAYACVYSHV